ncbi:MAG: thioredoxin domain-containing protein [Acidobacteriota bacterium]
MKKLSLMLLSLLMCGNLAIAAMPSWASQTPSAAQRPPAPAVECACEVKGLPEVYGTVNGVKITAKDVDDPIKDKIQQLQASVIEARKQQINNMVDAKLIEAEAKKRNLPAAKLIDLEITSKVKEPTESEASAFYEQNKDRLQGSYAQLHDEILAYLRAQRHDIEGKRYTTRLRAASQVKVLNSIATQPKDEADRARVVATIGAENITLGDADRALRPLIFEYQEKVLELRKAQFDVIINDLLLGQEAQKRKITDKQLFEAEVVAKSKKPTEEEAKKFYDENTAQIPGTFAETKDQILKYLQQQEYQKAEDELVKLIRKDAQIQVFLTDPDPPVYEIAIDDQPTKGSASATVTIVEFTDFQCPSCGKTAPVLDEIVKEYGDKVKLVVRDFPLTQIHAYALKAAEAAEAAREQGKYWEYAELLFKNQEKLDAQSLLAYANQVGLDIKKFQEAITSGKYLEKVQRDVEDGYKFGVTGTPTLFVNGKRVKDKSKETLKAAIDAALRTTAAK